MHKAELPICSQDILFLGEYERTDRKYADVRLKVEYSNNPEDNIALSAVIENNSNRYLRNYSYSMSAVHPTTNLDFRANGGAYWRPRWYQTRHIANYRRTYLPLQIAEASAMLDFDNNEIELKASTN